ncbi:hypothetical protein DPEC_G00301500 [Dallia pectoralis]|uniref:Uncharacterized protein n=1 Tax=Dallia pectoralis TaxID=75939 RepID=A0ACC2FGR0_DALPE|nr:hypothetical protein DPEC_G00301500 [Dallia pectoralis]
MEFGLVQNASTRVYNTLIDSALHLSPSAPPWTALNTVITRPLAGQGQRDVSPDPGRSNPDGVGLAKHPPSRPSSFKHLLWKTARSGAPRRGMETGTGTRDQQDHRC